MTFYLFPSTVEEVLPSLLSCLESHDHSVVMAAVSSVCDIALLCKGIVFSLVTNYTLFAL